MAQNYKPLILNVQQAGQIRQYILRAGGKFTVGQHGDNDLMLYGQSYPKRHTLILQKNGMFLLNIQSFIDGEITLDDSKLTIKDLVLHEVLPRKGKSYQLILTPRKQGVLTVGDAKIEFSFKAIKTQQPVTVSSPAAFSWTRATLNDLKSDLLFKIVFLVLFVINTLIIYSFKDYKIVEKKFDIEKIPQRLAKFIMKPREEIARLESKILSANSEGFGNKTNEKSGKSSSSERKGGKGSGSGNRRGNPAGATGLLGLLAGTGGSGKASSIVDALVDRGLVADLNNILGGGTHLKVITGDTKGGKNEDLLDQLIGTGGSGGGGIDDYLSSMEEPIPQVTLQKKVKVDLIKPSKVTGSSEALGYRTEQSIMDVLISKQGRITYLYEKYLKRNPELRGKITIEFTIAAEGFVTKAQIIESTMHHPELERELLAMVQRLKFDPIPSGNVTTVFPFLFSKIN